jgi:hypothetical protein
MSAEIEKKPESWKSLVAIAALVAPVFAVLWLGLTLTSHGGSFALAIAKIVFTIFAVVTAISGIRWMTTSGVVLLVEAILVFLWVGFRIEDYPPYGPVKTIFLLAIPLVVSGVLFVLAGGIKAGTWPPARFRASL